MTWIKRYANLYEFEGTIDYIMESELGGWMLHYDGSPKHYSTVEQAQAAYSFIILDRKTNEEHPTDPIVEQVVNLMRERSAVGIRKYGTTLADNPLTLRQWLQHALEETLDKALYLKAAIEEIEKNE